MLLLALVAGQYLQVLAFESGPIPADELVPADALNLMAWCLMMVGLLSGWKRERTAALLIASGWALWQIARGHVLPLSSFMHIPLLVAVLHASCWWATPGGGAPCASPLRLRPTSSCWSWAFSFFPPTSR